MTKVETYFINKTGPSQGVVLGKTYKVVKISGKFHAGGDHASGNICNSPQGYKT